MKTVVHTLTKLAGDDIMNHLGRVQDPDNSELVPYMRKLLSSGLGGKENSANEANGALSSNKVKAIGRSSRPNLNTKRNY